MGVIGEKWRCPKCNADVGGSMGELKNYIRKMHSTTRFETKVADAA
jgi:hypothetical protein